MKPKYWIKGSVLEVGHVAPMTTDSAMNTIVEILEGTFISSVFADQLVIGEGHVISIRGVSEKSVDSIAKVREISLERGSNLVFLSGCRNRAWIGWVAESLCPLVVL